MSLPTRQFALSETTRASRASKIPRASETSSATDAIEQMLVGKAQAGDEAALEQLFGRYNARICLYLARMVGDDEIGRELTQETFLKAWEALPRLRDPSRFTSWLYRIATNLAYDHLRRPHALWLFPRSQTLYEERVKGDEIENMEDMTRLERRVEETGLLTLALQKVPLAYRACVILQIVEELPQRQIAVLLGIKESSVSKYVSRGLQELRNAYLQLMNEQQTSGKES